MKDDELKKELPPQLNIPGQMSCSGLADKTYWLCPFLNVNGNDEFCNIFATNISGHRCKACLSLYHDGASINIRAMEVVA